MWYDEDVQNPDCMSGCRIISMVDEERAMVNEERVKGPVQGEGGVSPTSNSEMAYQVHRVAVAAAVLC